MAAAQENAALVRVNGDPAVRVSSPLDALLADLTEQQHELRSFLEQWKEERDSFQRRLDNLNKELKSRRQAADLERAARKVQEAKQRLETLMMQARMAAASGDIQRAKAIARQVKAVVADLRTALTQLKGGGGGGSALFSTAAGGGGTQPTTAMGAPPAQTASAPGAEGDAAGASTADTVAAAQAAGQPAATAGEGDATSSSGGHGTGDDALPEGTPDGAKASATGQEDEAASDKAFQAAKAEIAKEAKRVLELAKAVLRVLSTTRAKPTDVENGTKHEQDLKQEVRNALKEVRATDLLANELVSAEQTLGSGAGTAGGMGSVGGMAMPSLDISI